MIAKLTPRKLSSLTDKDSQESHFTEIYRNRTNVLLVRNKFEKVNILVETSFIKVYDFVLYPNFFCIFGFFIL